MCSLKLIQSKKIYKSPFPIFTYGEEWKINLINALANRTKEGEDWSDRITVLERRQFADQMLMFNRSTLYLMSLKCATLLLSVQKRLNIKGYQNPCIEVYKFICEFLKYPGFRFVERLNEIIHWLQSAGLYDLWYRRERFQTQSGMLKRSVELLRYQNEIVVEHFEFPTFVFYGWLAGVVMLVIEIIWKHFLLSRVKTLLEICVQKLRLFCRIVAKKIAHFRRIVTE